MGDGHKDRMFTPFSTKERLNVLVHHICEKEQLMESTVRDLLSNGWAYHENKWVKASGVVIDNI